MTLHSSILAWGTPWTQKRGGHPWGHKSQTDLQTKQQITNKGNQFGQTIASEIQSGSVMSDSVTPWTMQSMGFSRPDPNT